MSVVHLDHTNFTNHVAQNNLVVVKFGAPWCGPCRALAPLLDKFSSEYPHISFVDINVDEAPALAAQYGIRSLPTIMAWKDKKVVWTKIGLPSPQDLKKDLDGLV